MSKKKKISLTDDSLSNNPFASLDLAFSDQEIAEDQERQEQVEEREVASKKAGTVAVRIEKKGRGGKSVTVFYDFSDENVNLNDLLKRVKKSLGTGGTVRDDSLEFQGDKRAQAAEIFQSLGFKVKGQLK